MSLSNKKSTRRKLPKQASLGTGVAVSGTLSATAVPAKTYSRPPKQLISADVLVVAGGPAGIGAALGAARTGADTLLIERHAFFGGVPSWSLGRNINQMRPASEPRSVVHELVIEKLVAHGDQAVQIGQHQLDCKVNYLKVAVLDALDGVGCKYLVHLAAAGKSMGNCMAMGHAVAHSARKGIVPLALEVAELQEVLRNDGVDLDKGGTKQVDVSTAREI